MLKPALPLACALAALVSTGATRVYALSCALPELVVPTPDSVHVPTNTLVWCSQEPYQPSTTILLRDVLGNAVSGTQTELSLPWMDVLVFRPDAELAANSEYTVECPLRWQGQLPTHVFTTGPGSRQTRPAVPSVAHVNVGAENGGWGPHHYANFPGSGEPQTITVIDLGGATTLNPDAPSGAVADATFRVDRSDIYLGSGLCTSNWSGAQLGSSTTVALGAFDMTGAFSGWSDTVTVTIPSEYAKVPDEGEDNDPAAPIVADHGTARSSATGCDLGARGASPWGATVLLTALAWLGARRRRSS
jgi:hypothetical protein